MSKKSRPPEKPDRTNAAFADALVDDRESAQTARTITDYVVAVTSVAIAVATTLVFSSVFSRNPTSLFYAAVVVSACRRGFGPGLVAAALPIVAIDFFLMPSFFYASWRDATQASTFVGIALLTSWLNNSRDRAMADLRRAKQEADDANAAKDQFLAVLSHELRTPLTPVLGLATVLEQDETLSDENRNLATVMRRNIELEARLIDDLLDITRIRRGKLSLERKPVELTSLIQDVLNICDADVQAKQIRVRTVLPNGPRVVNGDPARLHQILWNLLKNAVKFTPAKGEVTINCCDDADGLKIDVVDSGIGIDPAVLPRIFNAFEQGGTHVTSRFGGIGLGLAISKALAEGHGGKLAAASEGPGRGSCFTLTLPPVALSSVAAPPEPPVTPAGEPLKVLLVEDHADTAQVMTRLLRNLNHNVVHADSVRAARELAETQPFDVVVSDIGLPDGSGVELMKHLSAVYQLRGIATSGYGMEEDIRRSLCGGFHAHLTKPVNIDLLEAAICELATYSRSA